MEYSREDGAHDLIVVNDDLDMAWADVEKWVVDEGRYGSKEEVEWESH